MNILTFDIEEWFHLLDNPSTKSEQDWGRYESRIHHNMDRIFQLLDETNSRATFFCLGWVARKYPEVIRRIDEAGYEVATHSDLHQLAYEQSPTEYRADLERSIKSLQDVTGKKVRSYRAPGFSIKEQNRWVFPLLLELGVEIDCSMFPARRAHGGDSTFGIAEPCYIDVNGSLLKEFPINTVGMLGKDLIFSGGGYFRLFPLPVLQYFMQQSPYVMTYFHPRDFDPGQPMVPGLSRMRQFKSYYGLGGCWGKLKQLLLNYEFVDLVEAEKQINWSGSQIQRFKVTV
ncbi:polysaccharide deacetylase family protein (PEP-CTERM system associated) [Larkinella arboricola]|uniref:Polysaccharide deacetylase family protein (PEP-CTERM system associated) n=1 Tax=Larkinella arboricola TaxID=643671 RepID=A0A327X4R8_LARAB|nr:polysaccharide deacetylase family protein [Larkinella arboricola]RAK00073.1 polysaccharide deacetylase family protein (PEP-CTERM system associated) [Larkinella arboricola]